jgi:T4 RnlA family RNA ligase
MMKKIDTDLLNQMIAENYVEVNKCPDTDLHIYNYTPLAQFEKVWNEITLQCRGLILDKNYNVVARPFEKFFNLGEQVNQLIPDEPFEVFEKMDGSLGILYFWEGKWCMATRGSFRSRQAMQAEKILQTKYAGEVEKLNEAYTYLFEIIYPSNRIVVDYNDTEDLVLLAVVDTQTGEELQCEELDFTKPAVYNGIKDIHQLKCLDEHNKEGFVVRFRSGLRYKIKFSDYLRIHKIITQVSTISIWEYMRNNDSFSEMLEKVPDEFYTWVKSTRNDLQSAYFMIEMTARSEFRKLETRKETAAYFRTCKYPSVMFYMLDNRDYADLIWKRIRPEFSKPYWKEVVSEQ